MSAAQAAPRENAATGADAFAGLSYPQKFRRPPTSGWRKALLSLSGGRINVGESADDTYHRALVDRVNHPIRGDYLIAVLSLKGGVGKTTTTVGLGSTFAHLRGDRVVAMDANPDLGTLSQRVRNQTQSTVRDLLNDPAIARYSDVRAHTNQAPNRLEILASERDPAISESFSAEEYRRTMDILRQYYTIIVTDCGTGLMHSAMDATLEQAHSLVIVTTPAIDGVRSAWATLDWLDAHGYAELVARSVVVINCVRGKVSGGHMDELTHRFLQRCRGVQVIPFDEHLAAGQEVDLDQVAPAARRAYVELAALVADDFANPHRPGATAL